MTLQPRDRGPREALNSTDGGRSRRRQRRTLRAFDQLVARWCRRRDGARRARAVRHSVQGASALALFLCPVAVLAGSAAATTPALAEQKAFVNLTVVSSPGSTPGYQIFGHANLSGSVSPTGTATFDLYAPEDPTCAAAPIFTSTVPVTTTSVDSGRFTTPRAGTYRWRASYSGDANNNAAGPTACGAAVVVDRATSVLNMQPSPPVAISGALRGKATLAGGYNPSGTMTFILTGPNDVFCASTPVYTSTVAVNGVGTYESGGYVPTQIGTYKWRASYNGDANSLAVGPTPCLDLNGTVLAVPVARSDDLDGDGRTDVAVFRPSNGTWYVHGSGGADTTKRWGTDGDVAVAGDYDGDRRTDLGVFRPSTGIWYISAANGTITMVPWGVAGDIAVPGDYDGDGKTDMAVYRPSTSVWYLRNSSTASGTTFYGTSGDVPVPADYDGDGRTDPAVYRPSSGTWFLLRTTAGETALRYGTSGDIPVPADYDGDDKADLAVYRPGSATWFSRSTAGASPSVITTLGTSGDIPMASDYDGDGRADRAVFRPSTGTWLVDETLGVDLTMVFGTLGDVPATALPSVMDLLS